MSPLDLLIAIGGALALGFSIGYLLARREKEQDDYQYDDLADRHDWLLKMVDLAEIALRSTDEAKASEAKRKFVDEIGTDDQEENV